MKRELVVGAGFLAIASCASAFPYKWYGIDPGAGILLGKTEVEDMPLTVCSPDDKQKGKCAVFLIEEFERLQTDYANIKARLKQCEERDQ
jgi:hypothetical protein